MRWYPNRSQWVTIWLSTAVVIASVGHGQRRAAAAYLLAGAVRTWSLVKSPGRTTLALIGSGVVSVAVMIVAMILFTSK